MPSETGTEPIKVNGEIDLRNSARLQEALVDGLLGTPTRLIVDLAAVSSIDGSGLDVLLGAHWRATAAAAQLLLRHPNAEVAHLLEQNGLPSAAAALNSAASVPVDRPSRPFRRTKPWRSACRLGVAAAGMTPKPVDSGCRLLRYCKRTAKGPTRWTSREAPAAAGCPAGSVRDATLKFTALEVGHSPRHPVDHVPNGW